MDDVALPSTTRSARRDVGVLLLAALAPASMLAVAPRGWYPFGPVKWLVVSVLVAAGSALVLRSGEVRLPRSIVVAVALLLTTLAVGAIVGLDPLYAWVGTPERRFGFVTWCLCAAALAAGSALVSPNTRRSLSRRPQVDPQAPPHDVVPSPNLGPSPTLMAGLILAGLGVGAVATAEALGWEPELLQAGGRLTATFGSAAYLGAAAALLLSACLGAALDRRMARWWRGAAIAAAPLLIVAMLGSGARAAWVGTAAAAVTILVARRPWRAVTRPVIVAAGIGLVLIGVSLVVLTPVGDRLGSLNDADAPGGQGRLDEWRVAASALADHPITGVGPEGYRIAFAEAVDADYERAHGRDQQPDRAHAAPLDVALAGGLPSLAAWLVVMGLIGRAAWRALTRGRPLLAGLAAALVAHWVGQLFLFPLVELEPLAWLLAGTVVASTTSPELAPQRPQKCRLSGASSRVPRTGAPTAAEVPPLGRQLRRSHRRGVVRRVGPIALGVVAAVALVSGVTELVADQRAGDAANALGRGDPRSAADLAAAAVDLRPDVVRLHLLAARAAVADEQGTLAGLSEVDAALDVSPGDPIARRERASLLVARARATQVPAHADEAATELREQLDRDPFNAALWRQQALLAQLVGDVELQRRAEQRAADLTPPTGDGG